MPKSKPEYTPSISKADRDTLSWAKGLRQSGAQSMKTGCVMSLVVLALLFGLVCLLIFLCC